MSQSWQERGAPAARKGEPGEVTGTGLCEATLRERKDAHQRRCACEYQGRASSEQLLMVWKIATLKREMFKVF